MIKVATKQHKDKLCFKRESIDTANIIEGKRNNQVITKPDQKTTSMTLRNRETKKS